MHLLFYSGDNRDYFVFVIIIIRFLRNINEKCRQAADKNRDGCLFA